MKTTTTRVQSDGTRPRLFRRSFLLQVLEGPDQGKSSTYATDSVTVGSAKQNDLVLTDPAISRHHLRIDAEPNGFVMADLDSTNGTSIGPVQLREVVVRGATDLRLGETVVRFSLLDQEKEIPLPSTDHFGAVLGCSPPMLELFSQLHQASQSDVTLLLEGETGTGKELIAQEIHRHSHRRDNPFVIVDCGAIPATLIESELFGHVRGAFTGATSDRPGAFEETDGGTVLLDEVGELDLSMQPQLLRVLERRQVKRLGEAHYRSVDVRVIAATHRDLRREVNRNAFRPDLYYRLAVLQLRVPPLRQRPEDIELLVSHMLPEIARRFGVGDQPPRIDDATAQEITRHPWPGNVRELRNFLERLVVLSGSVSGFDPTAELQFQRPTNRPSIDFLDTLPFREAKTQWMAHFDIEYLTRLLARSNNNVAEAARRSGIDRVHLFRLIKKYGLKR